MIIGLVIFGLAWVSFLMRYRLAQMMPAAREATIATFPRARNLSGVLPPYNPLHGRTGDPTQIQAAVAAYFQLHPASAAADAIWKQPDEQGRTMLHWAAYGIVDEVSFRAILSKMPELENQIDAHGDTPLIIAIEHGNLRAAEYILLHSLDAKAQAQTANYLGFTPLMYAAYFDADAAAASILSKFYHPQTEVLRTIMGVSAIDIAELRKSERVYARLLPLQTPPAVAV